MYGRKMTIAQLPTSLQCVVIIRQVGNQRLHSVTNKKTRHRAGLYRPKGHYKRLKIKEPLVPPKPKELDKA